MNIVIESDFLLAVTLISNYHRFRDTGKAVAIKKKDVLKLSLDEYQQYADVVSNGFVIACKLLK